MADHTPQWDLIPLHDFEVPSSPLQEQVKRNWRQILNLFQSDDTEQNQDVKDEWQALAQERLETYLPTFDIEASVQQLAKQLDFEQATLVIAPPFCGLPEIATHIAEMKEWQILDSPKRTDLSGEQTYPLPDEPFAIIGLEHFFVRRSNGYGAVRHILQQARHRPCLIVCGSWAWAFIQYLSDIPINDYAIRTVQSLADIEYWREQLRGEKGDVDIVYNGQSIFNKEDERYFKNLISQGRGNWGVIRAMLKHDMRQSDDYQNLFVEGKLPIEWVNQKRPMYFLTYSLLLHGPLSSDMLRRLHPMIDQVETHLRELHQLDFLSYDNRVWYVQPHAYPRIRSELSDQRFLVDAF